jgi:hypothetical protein
MHDQANVLPLEDDVVDHAAQAAAVGGVAGERAQTLRADHDGSGDAVCQAAAIRDRAEEQQGPERFQSYRTLGDAALFLSGFCPERFERAGLNLQYAIDLGGQAYARTGDLARRGPLWIGDGPQLYDQLAEAFEALVRILDDVRQQTVLRTRADILSLYERWWESRSPRLARQLARHGVTPQVLGGGNVN